MKHNRFVKVLGISSLAVLILMLFLTSPTEIGPLGVLVFFTAIYIFLFSVISLLFALFIRLAFRRRTMSRKEYRYSAVLAFAPIMLLVIRSFGAINIWAILLVIVFLFLAEFLVYKRVL